MESKLRSEILFEIRLMHVFKNPKSKDRMYMYITTELWRELSPHASTESADMYAGPAVIFNIQIFFNAKLELKKILGRHNILNYSL